MIHKSTTPKIYIPQDRGCVLDLDSRDVRGGKIYDRSGKGNHGTVTGAVLKSRNYGIPILKFDGANDLISVPDNASLNFGSSDFTFCFWMKSVVAGPAEMMSKRSGLANSVGFMCAYTSLEVASLEIDDGLGNEVNNSGTTLINDGVWHFIVGKRDGNNIHILTDNADEHTADVSAVGSISNAIDLEIGRNGNVSRYFNGNISNAQLYSRALSASEISKIFDRSRHSFGR